MLSLHRITRLLDAEQPDRLWVELAQAGIEWPLPLRARLESVPAAAWALALRRVCELTLGPTPLADRLTQRLLHAQQPHGTWSTDGNDDRGHEAGHEDPLVTALAAVALRRRAQQPGTPPHEAQALQHAHRAAIASLAHLQNPADGLFGTEGDPNAVAGVGRTPGRVAEACYILFLLAEDPEALAALRLLPLRDALEAHAADFPPALVETHAMANLLLDAPVPASVPATVRTSTAALAA